MTLTATSPLTGTWTADPVHSSVDFEIEHLGVSTFRGSFRKFDAALTAGEDGLRLAGTARVESVDVQDPQLEAHLLSPDFFDAERTPEIRFESNDLRVEGGEVSAVGSLTIRGETREVAARGRIGGPGVDHTGNERVGLELSAAVDRRDFGVDFGMDLPNGQPMIGDDVRLLVHLELTREA